MKKLRNRTILASGREYYVRYIEIGMTNMNRQDLSRVKKIIDKIRDEKTAKGRIQTDKRLGRFNYSKNLKRD